MNVHLTQLGCRLNYGENHQLARQLRQAGHAVVDRPADAQVIVVNTCAVTAEAGRKSRQLVRAQAQANPRARIVATGCYATLEPAAVRALPGVWQVTANRDKGLLAALLEEWSAELPDPQTLEWIQADASPIAADAAARTRAFIKVQDGCNNKCAFCVVTLARGASRSVEPARIVAEIQELAAAGFQEAVLTGVHLGSYGRDFSGARTGALAALVHRILRETDIARLRLSSLEPWDVADDFFDLWAAWPRRLCPHLHLPLQAGADSLLQRMGRRCTVASFARLVQQARQGIPDVTLTTDFIVGFPGETEAEFEAGLQFLQEMRFAHVHAFPFSARAGTRAAGFPDQIAKARKKERMRQVQALAEDAGRQERSRFLHTVRPVLWEGSGRVLDDGSGRLWSGYTDNYLKTEAVAPAAVVLTNRITPVRLEALQGQVMVGALT